MNSEKDKELKLNELKSNLDLLIKSSSTIFPEAAKLWELSTSKFNDNTGYIKRNGKQLTSFIDIDEPSLRTEVKIKLESQGMSLKSKGIRFRYDSSLADSIIKSQAMKNFIKDNKHRFKQNIYLPKTTIEFKKKIDPDLYLAIHHADVNNIYIDFYERFTAKVVDTYDFNNDENKFLVEQANALQNAGHIETYFIIVDIVIPKDVWENY